MWNGKGNGLIKMTTMVVRAFASKSRSRAVNLRKINPRVPYQEAASIAESLYGVIKSNGPLTVSNAWNHAKDAGVSGLDSKTHMKLLLKWMMGRGMLKLICNHVGSNKKFLITTLPEDPRSNQASLLMEKEGKYSKSNKKKVAQ